MNKFYLALMAISLAVGFGNSAFADQWVTGGWGMGCTASGFQFEQGLNSIQCEEPNANPDIRSECIQTVDSTWQHASVQCSTYDRSGNVLTQTSESFP